MNTQAGIYAVVMLIWFWGSNRKARCAFRLTDAAAVACITHASCWTAAESPCRVRFYSTSPCFFVQRNDRAGPDSSRALCRFFKGTQQSLGQFLRQRARPPPPGAAPIPVTTEDEPVAPVEPEESVALLAQVYTL